MAIAFRGASAIGNGKHIMTGPIHICGAEPGDVVKIEILVGDQLAVQLAHYCGLPHCCCSLPARPFSVGHVLLCPWGMYLLVVECGPVCVALLSLLPHIHSDGLLLTLFCCSPVFVL
jgi:hypothetical protein